MLPPSAQLAQKELSVQSNVALQEISRQYLSHIEIGWNIYRQCRSNGFRGSACTRIARSQRWTKLAVCACTPERMLLSFDAGLQHKSLKSEWSKYQNSDFNSRIPGWIRISRIPGIPGILEFYSESVMLLSFEAGLQHKSLVQISKFRIREFRECQTRPSGHLEIGNELISGIFCEHWSRKLKDPKKNVGWMMVRNAKCISLSWVCINKLRIITNP